jgi:hypothetical protein
MVATPSTTAVALGSARKPFAAARNEQPAAGGA